MYKEVRQNIKFMKIDIVLNRRNILIISANIRLDIELAEKRQKGKYYKYLGEYIVIDKVNDRLDLVQ